MELAEYKNIFEHETSHFLYTTRHKLVFTLLRKYVKGSKKLKILDAGCGTGFLAKKLEVFGKVWAIDIHKEAIKLSKLRGVNAKQASVTNLPFKTQTFDVVTSIDVIYHQKVRDDIKAIKEFFRVLKPGGILIIRVPANKWLHLIHDKHVHTRQRYNKEELKIKLIKAGFVIKKISFVNMPLLPIAIIRQMIEKLQPANITTSGVNQLPTLVNKFLTLLLTLEINYLKVINIPFGLGLVAAAEKPRQ